MEDYEKLYKNALENMKRFRDALNNHEETDLWALKKEIVTDIEYYFPELKDSEDERVKKRILLSLEKDLMATKNSGCDIQDLEQCIAWLEKQGGNNNQNWKPSKGQINALEHFVRSIGESGYASPYDDNTKLLYSLINDLYKLKKQDEQKPILDFKASNWYVSKVDGKIHDMTYNPTDRTEPKFKVGDFIVYDYCMGRIVEITNDAYLLDIGQGIPFSCEDNVHLWTIKDANEGNILAGKIDGDSYIFIFKTIKDGWIETYGHYYNAVNRFCVPSQLFCRDYQGTFIPATKEQRDTLMKAMADAGYEWDADKKELKKLTQSVTKKSDKVWSDEDEERIKNTLSVLDVQVCWDGATGKKGNPYQKEIDWLKSIKERIIWKPSKKQMETLEYYMHTLLATEHKEVLFGLYNDLKKL